MDGNVARRSERALGLSEAERLGCGLPIGVRLRVAIELLRSLADGPQAPAVPRAAESRLLFERVAVSPGDVVGAAGPGDVSGAALLLWEILAGRPLDAEAPLRLHDIVDDMPADVDDLVMGALRPGAPPTTAAELLDELSRAGESYAVARHGLWDRLASAAPSIHANGSARASNHGAAPAVKAAATPPSTRAPAPAAPSLLLIHAGEEARPLADALRAAGYLVVVYHDAESSLAHAIAETPLCIVCDADLPDADGEAVVRRIREQPSAVAAAPFVLLVADGDTPRRVARFGAGADVCVLKPITIAALVQQVDALVDMSSRLRAASHARSAPPRASEAAALTGDIRQVGIAAVLTILEMERRTGSFVATSEGERGPSARVTLAQIGSGSELALELARGRVAGASRMGVPACPVEVVGAMMRLAAGRFAFKPTRARYVDAPSLSELLSEAARLEDEAAAERS